MISALIHNIRGGDPDAGPYWLARVIVAGEDPATAPGDWSSSPARTSGWPTRPACSSPTAAAHAVEYVGLPEAQLNLAQAVVHLATAPKSDRTALGIWRAIEDVRSRPVGPVPPHLRDAHYRRAERIGHGVGYRYPPRRPPGLGGAGRSA